MATSSPKLSCLMVTLANAPRWEMLCQSIASYLAQTYGNKELVIVVDNQDEAERKRLLAHISTLQRPDIRCVFPERKLSLGALRNLSMDQAAGDVSCQWDDDDLSHPERVAAQLKFLLDNKLDAVLLANNLHIFYQQGICYWQRWRRRIIGHPATLMAMKGHGIRYPETGAQSQREEDINFLAQLRNKCRVGCFEAPAYYYLYAFHGGNTWDFAHHRMLAKLLAVPREQLLLARDDLVRGIGEVPQFGLPGLVFMENKGPLFVWTRATGAITPPEPARGYRSRSIGILPGAPGKSLLQSPVKSRLLETPAALAQPVSKMTEFKRLDEHAWDICASQKPAPADFASIRGFLGSAAEAGLLVSEDELKAEILSHIGESRPQAPLSTLAFLTFNRPAGLQRCVESFLKNLQEHGKQPRIVVADDSDEPSALAANEACLKELKNRHPAHAFFYAGPTEKRRFADELARHSGVDPEEVEFALFNPERLGQKAGANRNALFLEATAERFLSVDDDVVCRPCPAPGADDTVEITSDHDPSRVRLFPDRETLLKERQASNCDLHGLHEQMLGKDLGAVLATGRPATFGQLHPSFLNLLEKKAARIRVSWTGIYGDSGARYPTYYLWKDDEVQAQLAAGEEAYRRLSLSREIFRAPGRLHVGRGGNCQSTALAYDHTSVLPPFMPVLRGEDILFAKTLGTCFPSAVIGYLPWAVLHAPLEGRSNVAADIAQAARATPLYQILHALIGLFPASEYEGEAESLTRLGAHLCALGQLPVQEFEEILSTQLWAQAAMRIDQLRQQLWKFGGQPAYWARDIEAHIQVISGKLTATGLRQSIMREECGGYTSDERLVLAQRLTLRFGKLLGAWPALTVTAGDLKSRGIGLARPLD